MRLKSIEELNLSPVVSLVGAGGKTTLMYHFAEQLAGQGKKVLVTTTTHIYQPDPACFAACPEEVRCLWRQGKFAVIGTPIPSTGKLTTPGMDFLHQMMQEADAVLVEADGAKRFPVKAPRAQEPVLLPQTEQVIAVMGLSAIGRSLKECCFGLKEAMILLNAPEDHVLTAADAAFLLSSEQGGRKNVGNRRFSVILNQCDDENAGALAAAIASRLRELGTEDVYVSSFAPFQRDFYNMLADAGNIEA